MESNKAIDLLKSLDETELKEFADFIRSPFFNKSEVLVRLFEILEKSAPEYSGQALKKENLHKKLYPKKSFNEQSLKNRMAELSALLKEYYTMKSFKEDEMARKKSFIKELRKKRRFSLAEKQISEAIKFLNERGNFEEVYFKDMLEILYESAKISTAKDEKLHKQKISYERNEHNLNYFLLNLLIINHDILSNEIEQKIRPDFNPTVHFLEMLNLEKYLGVLEERRYKHHPLMAIYYYSNILMEKPENEEIYWKLKALIFKYYAKFDLSQIYNFWTILSNCLFLLYQKNGMEFAKESHEINKFFIEKKLFPIDRAFSSEAYQNSITNAVMIKEFEWAEEFAEEFKSNIAPEAVNNKYNYCKAMICFARKKYEDSITHLSLIKPDDWFFKVYVRMYYLRNYYELGMPEQIFSLIDSFRHFMANNTEAIPGYLDDKIKNTLDYMNKITTAKFDGKKLDYADYKEAINAKTLLYKDWMVVKMKELI